MLTWLISRATLVGITLAAVAHQIDKLADAIDGARR